MTDPATVEREQIAGRMLDAFLSNMPQRHWSVEYIEHALAAMSRALAAHEAAIKDAGMVVVPREPTEAMINDEGTWAYQTAEDAAGVYRAMIAAYEALHLDATP